jgi:histidyl-tRNA synthetase
MAIDLMLDFGFQTGDFRVRLSDRRVWDEFIALQGLTTEQLPEFLQIIDKLEREKPEVTEAKLVALGTTLPAVRAFMADSTVGQRGALGDLMENLGARGLAEHVQIDLGIVRGLAYYTGVVFEIFDARGKFRAVAGGGRYDNLCGLVGGVDVPAVGFAMGDMVIAAFIESRPQAKSKLMAWQSKANNLDIYVVLADESKRHAALAAQQALRADGIRVDSALGAAKVGAQFQAAEYRKARLAIVIGAEYPQVKIKDMVSREEVSVELAELVPTALEWLAKAEHGPLLADS